jgi:hypothetical protein
MSSVRPGILAVRAVNQYRRRDVLAYLGLRYYLANRCAVRDRWAREVAVHLVVSRTQHIYFHALHFKEHRQGAAVEHRDIHLPGPNEALAEAALLDECSRHPEAFDALPCVFSYQLAREDYKQGMFQAYFPGFRERHRAVAEACRRTGAATVLYTDIKRFYPTVSKGLAEQAWKRACDIAQIADAFRNLGERILQDHATVAKSLQDHTKPVDGSPKDPGLLTGPMFSHLIGNLALKDVDARMSELLPRGYFRYVDDVVLVGSESQVNEGQMHLAKLLEDLGLHLHLHDSDKGFRVPAHEWMEGANDFEDNDLAGLWITFIRELKQLLLSKARKRDDLQNAFAAEGMRMPVPDYSEAVREAASLANIISLATNAWFRLKVGQITVPGLVQGALKLRHAFTARLRAELKGADQFHGYQRKRRIPKLRFLAGRLTYLATPEELVEFSGPLRAIPELRPLAEVFKTVGSRDVTDLLPLGVNAVQAAAQVLRLTGRSVRCQTLAWRQAESQGLAILRFNGVAADACSDTDAPDDDLNRFGRWDGNDIELMRCEDLFVRELACLHGIGHGRRHEAILDVAFDRDEQLAFDAISQLQPSSYF